jgi:hypothetical protein
MVIACVALFIALGGVSVAAVVLAPNSVGTSQLKDNAVTSPKVKDGTLLRADFKAGQLSAARWALVRPDGTIVAQSGGISLTARPSNGNYVLDFGSSVAGKLIYVSSALANDAVARGQVGGGPCGGADQSPPCAAGDNKNHVHVFTLNPSNTKNENHAFYVAVS